MTVTPTLIRKTAIAEIKALDEAKGLVTAYVNSLEVVDYDQEVIASGAFDASIKASLPAVAWMHDQRTIVGGVTEAHEEDARLLATMQFDLDTEPGAYAFKMVARGRVREWSVGFYASSWRMEERDGKAIRVIEAVEWVEVSPVLRGASPGTQTTGVKAHDGDPDFCPACNTSHREEPQRTCEHGGATKCPASAPCAACAAAAQGAAFPHHQKDEGPDPAGERADGRAAQRRYFSEEYDTGIARLLEEQRRWLQAEGGVDIPLVVGKAGKRTSAADTRRVQAMHDLAMELGATCDYDNAPAPEAALPATDGEG